MHHVNSTRQKHVGMCVQAHARNPGNHGTVVLHSRYCRARTSGHSHRNHVWSDLARQLFQDWCTLLQKVAMERAFRRMRRQAEMLRFRSSVCTAPWRKLWTTVPTAPLYFMLIRSYLCPCNPMRLLREATVAPSQVDTRMPKPTRRGRPDHRHPCVRSCGTAPYESQRAR